jgi:TetR/AcrR family transcriptional repressor of nem operon
MTASIAPPATTREQLVAHAQTLIRQRGYNGFSYRDLADLVGVKTASIHYHFPQKEDLLLAAVSDYTGRVTQALRAIDASLPAAERLERYASLFYKGPKDQVCMGGVLAADFASVPEPVREALQGFFRINEEWLAGVVADGAREGTLKSSGDMQVDGRSLFAAFQGAMLASRLFQSPQRVLDVCASMRVRQPQAAPA